MQLLFALGCGRAYVVLQLCSQTGTRLSLFLKHGGEIARGIESIQVRAVPARFEYPVN